MNWKSRRFPDPTRQTLPEWKPSKDFRRQRLRPHQKRSLRQRLRRAQTNSLSTRKPQPVTLPNIFILRDKP
jgi:hypothetical protein